MNEPDDGREIHRLISALADGEADAQASAQALRALAQDDAALGRWHAYHLIGDVLRSGDLAAAPASDRRFLETLRPRLAGPADAAAGPAPRAVPVPLRKRPQWAWPVALAASVAALATALVVLRLPAVGDGAAQLAGARPSPTPDAANASTLAALQPANDGAGGRMLRDAQLDRYLRAHRDYGAAHPVSLPGGPGRSVETVSFER